MICIFMFYSSLLLQAVKWMSCIDRHCCCIFWCHIWLILWHVGLHVWSECVGGLRCWSMSHEHQGLGELVQVGDVCVNLRCFHKSGISDYQGHFQLLHLLTRLRLIFISGLQWDKFTCWESSIREGHMHYVNMEVCYTGPNQSLHKVRFSLVCFPTSQWQCAKWINFSWGGVHNMPYDNT